ncbi:hypothetical protein F0562_028951 [Nyssa sinensis]|uniref:Protein kinase domain-containing protein n=1 Tax=Nyssa sinensis TaxID=561372 RepID=A0A5J5AZL0_9ASTE|nr:hypothetical protein F0562_028951 [Nyssa sinensis]
MGSLQFFKNLLLITLLLLFNRAIAQIDPSERLCIEERDALSALRDGFNNSFLNVKWANILCYLNHPPELYGIQRSNDRITGIVLENLGLTGKVEANAFVNLTMLAILSFKNNSISGEVMDFSLNQKMIQIDLSSNKFDGQISDSLLTLNFLESLQLQHNMLTGSIPEFNQSTLRQFNVSNNQLSGPIPNTADSSIFQLLFIFWKLKEEQEKNNASQEEVDYNSNDTSKLIEAKEKRAMMDDGPAVVVKRLRDLKPLTSDEFASQLQAIADQKHPNLLPLIAYYYSRDEKLLVHKFASNGNVYNRLHVARGVARALEHLHLNTTSQTLVPHGNLKSSNVLLDENEMPLVSDYGLTSLIALPILAQRMVSYKSPEYLGYKKVSKKSDVWSYGGFLLELLTGKVSAHSAHEGLSSVDLCNWVHRAVREEWTAEIFDLEIAAQRSANHGMLRLLNLAVRCCDKSPEKAAGDD